MRGLSVLSLGPCQILGFRAGDRRLLGELSSTLAAVDRGGLSGDAGGIPIPAMVGAARGSAVAVASIERARTPRELN
eukprot:2799896-Pyramimonas_sp.AAC.1